MLYPLYYCSEDDSFCLQKSSDEGLHKYLYYDEWYESHKKTAVKGRGKAKETKATHSVYTTTVHKIHDQVLFYLLLAEQETHFKFLYLTTSKN